MLVYVKQHNYCINLLHQKKKKYFENLNISGISDNIFFWKNLWPLFAKNVSKKSKITFIEKRSARTTSICFLCIDNQTDGLY